MTSKKFVPSEKWAVDLNDPNQAAAIQLTEKNFDEFVLTNPIVLVMFYAHWYLMFIIFTMYLILLFFISGVARNFFGGVRVGSDDAPGHLRKFKKLKFFIQKN